MSKLVHDLLKKIVKHSESNGFINFIEKNDSFDKFVFGPAGEVLFDTLRKEWILSNVICRENNVFMFNSSEDTDMFSDIKLGYSSAKQLSSGELPFGLADTRKLIEFEDRGKDVWEPRSFTRLRYLAFCDPAEAEQYFYRYQQERKRWWRKFSTDPGRFSFSEIEKQEGGEVTKILAEFPWGSHCVERVYYRDWSLIDSIPFSDQNLFSVNSGKKRCLPQIVECQLNLDYAVFTYICDAYTTKKNRCILKFHRKLAPYKFAFAAPSYKGDELKDLYKLAELLCLTLRKSGINSLFPVRSEFGKKKLDFQLLKSDVLGIPYTAVLSQNTLETGIFGLYSRDTTLQEDVHISQMEEYGPLLMKNY